MQSVADASDVQHTNTLYISLMPVPRSRQLTSAHSCCLPAVPAICLACLPVRLPFCFVEVPMIPAADLQTVDALWRAASNNKFGYSVQKEMWVQVRSSPITPACEGPACRLPRHSVVCVSPAAWLHNIQ